MKKNLILKSQAGFSLIELMVVVAIIGILAAVAIPNYTRFNLKARQAEAKSQLGSLFMAEKAYINEYTDNSSMLSDIGSVPDGNFVYNCGLVQGAGARTAGTNPAVAPANTGGDFTTWCAAAPAGTCQISPGYVSYNLPTANINIDRVSFTAECVADLTGTGAAFNDQWTLNQGNVMTNVVSAIQ